MTTVAPLASDPAIQQAIADQVTAQVLTYLDVPGVTNQVVDALAERGLTRLLATRQGRARPHPGPAGGACPDRVPGRRPVDAPVEAQAPVE